MLSCYQWWSQQLLGNFLMQLICNSLYNIHYCFLGFDVMNLQLVETEGHMLDRILRVPSPNLIWLSWRHCPYTSLPFWIKIKNLRVLKVEGGVLETLWQSKSQAPLQLQELEIINASCLWSIPKSIGQLKHLERIVVLNAGSLKSLPDSLSKLTNLHSLDLGQCGKLERLPDSFGSLTNLHSLNLGWCQKLERLPDSFGSLTNLHSLDLRSCWKLERLPDSFGSLTALKYFDASSCASLRISSETFGNIRTLEHIDLSGCEKVEVFPWQLAHQRSLKTLKLTGTNFKEMPSAIELPRDLEVLWIGNPLLDRVMPSSLGDLLNLKELHLQYPGELKCLSASVERPSELSWLKVAGCPIIHTSELFYDNVEYPKLEELILEECINLAEVGTLPKALTKLTLIGCDNLKSIRDLRWLTKLQQLEVHGCPELGELEGVADCRELKWFSVKGCPKLRLNERVVERLRQKCRRQFELDELSRS